MLIQEYYNNAVKWASPVLTQFAQDCKGIGTRVKNWIEAEPDLAGKVTLVATTIFSGYMMQKSLYWVPPVCFAGAVYGYLNPQETQRYINKFNESLKKHTVITGMAIYAFYYMSLPYTYATAMFFTWAQCGATLSSIISDDSSEPQHAN